MNNKITNQMVSNRQKKKRLFVRTLVMTLFMALFTQIAQAQVYMHNGSSYVSTSGVKFYDSGGPSKGPANYWLHWFGRNQDFTYTFNPEQTGYAIQVDFEAFTAYTDNNGTNDPHPLESGFSLRLNDAELSIYEGDAVSADKLITTLTGTIIEPFTVMSNGPITFRFKSYGFTEEGWGATVKAVQASSYGLQKPAISMEVCSDLVVLYPTTLGASIRYTTGNPNNNNPSATNGTLYTEPFSVTYPTTVKAVTVNGNNASEVADKTYNANDATPVPNINDITIVRDGNTIIITPPEVPDRLNETYGIIYTYATNGDTPENPDYISYQNPNNVGEYIAPDGWNGTMPGLVHFEWTIPNTNFKFCVVAQTCAKQSAVKTYNFAKLQVPDPTINITDNNNVGTATINWESGYVIRYTVDGTTPSTTNGTLVSSGTTVTVNSLTPGQTVKVVAYKVTNGSVDTNYEPSDVVSEMYLPGGGASGTYGGTVILNDLEEHEWSYYSDATNPIRSLNPADIKITYLGNGKMYTSTGVTPSGDLTDVTGVKVSASENEDTFLYLKTLERANGEAGTGNLAYTLIPNPFTVRPKFTLQGTSYYTGFYGWRVKSLSGVSISGYNVGSIIPAETEIQFVTNNSKGNEVEFEAVWARAYVATSNTTSGLEANAGYERNFVYLTNNTTLSGNGLSVPVTYTTLDPATGTGTKRTITFGSGTADYFRCQTNTKFENIIAAVRSNSTYVSAQGKDFVFGRGITGASIPKFYGAYGISTTLLNFRVRLESGFFGAVYALGYNFTATSQSILKMTLGCDYDRAKNKNDLFRISGILMGSSNVGFSSSANVNYANYDYVVKSGEMQSSIEIGDGGMNNAFYLGGLSTGDYQGGRKMLVEGGVFKSIAGGFDYDGSASNYGVNVRIKGGLIQGSVYGAAAYAGAKGNRRFVFTGGTINGWIAGGCNGTETTGGQLDGNSYIYFGGKAKCTSNGNNTLINSSRGGNIFGAGCGIEGGETVGQVNNSTIVIADDAEMEHNVYGGGNYGYVSEGTGHKSDIYVLGGTIDESVYGGANQQQGQIVNITMKKGTVTGNLYGGSNTTGTINGLATINVSGGTVTNVFGGGYGASTNMASGTAVNVSGGTINNNVYGGGELGTVTGNTNVNVSGGTMKDVYGAGKGASEASGSKATITGQTFVNVTGGTIANVYGGGENGNVAPSSGGGSSSGETLTYDFEDGTLQGWTAVDADGDGFNWFQHTNTGTGNFTTHGGDGCVVSASYDNDTYTILYPNNWLISPQIQLGGSISFWAVAQESSYPDEHYAVYVSTTGTDVSNFTSISDEFVATSQYTQRTIDLSSYSGRGYVAIRHFNCSDQFFLNVDDITITQPVVQSEDNTLASTVTINGGNISENVFGGGAYGTTAGNTIVNMKNGSVHGSVYGGALGEQGAVYVAGSHTVNVLGGRVYSNVYGGSRNANDALSFDPGTFADDNHNVIATNDETVCVVNISGGQIDQQVYAAGYYGNCFGSVYAFIGKDAIYNAPHHVETAGQESAGEAYEIAKLSITGSVWAGGDWGMFDGTFGAPTISGNSNVYIDGQDYITNTSDKNTVGYMGIDGSVFGSGTSCDAGNKEHTVMLRNYGESSDPFTSATRNFASIQRADYLVLDNVHLDFQGQGLVNSLNVTELYSIYEVSEAVIVTGGSTLIMDAPIDQIKSFWSASCNNVFTADLPTSQTAVGGYTALNPSTLSNTPNKVRVNGGNYIKIYHDKQIATVSGDDITYTPGYGMLNGYAYMMASSGDNEATCAYARPRWCYKNTATMFEIDDPNYDNRNDGGWVSYVSGDNVFDLAGYEGTIQMEYENHTPGSKVGEQYFRIWRSTGQIHEREGIFDVVAHGEDVFKYVDVEIELPAWRGHDYYYMFQTQGQGSNLNTTIDYGTELMVFNTALYGNNSWMTYDVDTKAQKLEANTEEQDEIKAQPEVNYGLVILPGTGNALSSPQIDETAAPALIINNDADAFLASQNNGKPVNSFTFTDNTEMPTVTFRLTYSDLLNSNKTYEPIWVNLVQCDKDGNVKDIVKVKLIVNTSTVVGRDFKAQVYAVMNGNGSTAEESHVQVVLPRFTLNQGGVDSHFTVESITWTPASTSDGAGQLVTVASNDFDKTKFAMEFSAADNYDGTTGWNELNYTIYDTKVLYGPPATTPKEMGTTSARTQFSFDFNLYYNGNEEIDIDKPELLGTIVYNMKFTNYGTTSESDPLGHETFTITIEVYRRGKGTRYYLDGVNGKNSNTGTFPDQAMLTLSALFNRSGFLPGDEIYVVNQVTAEDGLEWNGLAKGGNVLIYRYNGGHKLSGEDAEIIGNENNTAYTGALINVPNGATMTIHGITLDGYYNNGGDGSNYSTVASEAALITVQNGGSLELNQNTNLQQNYNVNDGGAVYVYEGGTLMMNEDAHIQNNKSEYDGAGVYMNGTMIVADQVVVWDNMGNGNTQNNVYLASKASVLQIGVDADSEHYQALAYNAEDASQSAKIGLTKSTSNFTAGVAEVVYSNVTSWLTEPLETQAIIVHDGDIYNLETGASANMLYWRDTWVTFVTSQPEGFNINNIDSEEDLAWLISLVNGENNQTANTFENQTVVVKKNLDMGAHTWVPIGERNNVFKGTFEGNGYTIEGLNSSLNRTDLGMFGIAEGATIQNVIAQGTFDGIANNYGTIAGTMKGGTISNVEAAGTLTGDANYAQNIGGLVGVTETGTTIHSSFAVNTLTAQRDETVVGGLVAQNGGDLYNSYANVTITGTDNTPIGGLVGVNDGTVENCYVVLDSQTFPAFAATNNNKINYCYADKQTTYVGSGTDPVGSGYYAAVTDRKAIGYMYADNKVNASNDYVVSTISYDNNHIDKWPGLLSTLNQWVKAKSNDNITYTSWLRPTSANINGDLPVLTFATGNSLGTTDGKFLKYAVTSETDNGLDALLELYNGKTSYIFLYDNATEVTKVPATRTYVFINEDAVLLQKQGAKGDFINTTVGVTFDNSDHGQHAVDYDGTKLEYDWHLLSTPLADAPLGITYDESQDQNWWTDNDNGQVTGVSHSYMPDNINESDAKWDFYTYYEPEYHWINFKRNSASHNHYDEPHDPISYTNETELVQGKGYMMAIDKDTYMSNTGTLNNGDVEITLTLSGDQNSDTEPTKDWGSNLIGNPYQAYLDLTKVTEGTGLRSFWIYDADNAAYGPFMAGASVNPVIPSQYIHPHQAFFVVIDEDYAASHPDNSGNNGGKEDEYEQKTAKTAFTYDMATATSNPTSYFRGNEQPAYPVVNLFVDNERGNRDLAIIELNRPELNGVRKVNNLRNANFKLYAHYDGGNYGLLFTPEDAERVPVHFRTMEDGKFTMTWSTYNGTFTNLILVDNLTGTRTNMLTTDHYTFEGSVDDYAARFYITFNVTDVDELNGENDDFIWFDGNDWIVTGKGQLDVIDVTGRVLRSERVSGEQTHLHLDGVAAGVYMMRLTDGNKAKTQKIVIR